MKLVFCDLQTGENHSPQPGELWLESLFPGDRSKSVSAIEFDLSSIQTLSPIDTIVVQRQPSLDDMLAAEILVCRLNDQQVPDGIQCTTEYAKTSRQGLLPGHAPLESSLQGVYLAIRYLAPKDLSDATNAKTFLNEWNRLRNHLFDSAELGLDPHEEGFFQEPGSTTNSRSQFSTELAFLKDDKSVYLQDVARGKQWLAQIPGGPPTASALFLEHPRSLLFSQWCRIDSDSPTADGYLLLIVDWGDGHWAISTPRSSRIPLQSLCEQLDKLENKDGQKWFDGQCFAYTLIASPKPRTEIPDETILATFKKWCNASSPRVKTNVDFGNRRNLAAVVVVVALLLGTGYLLAQLNRPVSEPLTVVSKDIETEIVRPGPNGEIRKGQMWVLSIGVSDYLHFNDDSDSTAKGWVLDDLEVADDDARMIYEDFGGLPEKQRTLLVDKDATKDNIMKSLEFIEENAVKDDLVLITISGHGIKHERYGAYMFLPHEFDPDRAQAFEGISWDQLKKPLTAIKCNVVLLLDTCHSGGLLTSNDQNDDEFNRKGFKPDVKKISDEIVTEGFNVLNDTRHGVIIIASSRDSEYSLEMKNKHGVLTLAFREAMLGKRLYNKKIKTRLPVPTRTSNNRKGLSLESIRNYLVERVRELSDGRQTVVADKPNGMTWHDIVLALTGESNADSKSEENAG